ncbi:BspA family leucine-rich repeat surface protein [Mariniflexile sp. AS56]|uniref:BspA family leucine-rich repeat surface protein n=1 Tax=Mariniflexile sp. AS56 TaxID=3063957 RepID=UPI0026F15691|nr:BspA family leucine-rich repeat surface protein [Mariniflexile sp. AS56]MDO7172455.1 BspA family leucine-rich repeat surface protein [Mariniflexile sp. AS56]
MLKKIILSFFCLVIVACELEIPKTNLIILDIDAIYTQTGTAVQGDHIGVIKRVASGTLEEGVFDLLAEETLEEPTIEAAGLDGFTFELIDQSVDNAIEISTTGVITINDINAFDPTRYDRIIVNYVAFLEGKSKEGTFFIDIIVDTTNSEFITVWNVEAGDTIILPLYVGDDTDYNFTINWENTGDPADDVAITSFDDPDAQHTFADAGLKTITIKGLIKGFNFAQNGASSSNLVDVKKWGFMYFGSQPGAFQFCDNLVEFTATDNPLIGSTTNMQLMFFNARAFNGDLTGWNVSQVTSMHSTFRNCFAFNGDISTWDVSSVTTLYRMFFNASAFNSDISNWDVSNVTEFGQMFRRADAFNGDISNWDVSSATSFGQMFRQAAAFNVDISGWDVSNVTGFASCFLQASTFNQDISGWTVSSATDMTSMFNAATNFSQDLSGWDTSVVGNCGNFDVNSSLTEDQLPKLGCFSF